MCWGDVTLTSDSFLLSSNSQALCVWYSTIESALLLVPTACRLFWPTFTRAWLVLHLFQDAFTSLCRNSACLFNLDVLNHSWDGSLRDISESRFKTLILSHTHISYPSQMVLDLSLRTPGVCLFDFFFTSDNDSVRVEKSWVLELR